jgi:hypothetical protein
MTIPWRSVQVMQWSKHDSKKPRDQARENEKLRGPGQKSAESCGIRSFIQFGEKLTTRAHMHKGKDLEDSGTDTGRRRPRTGPKWAQAGRPRPAGPVHFRAQSPPFDLSASRAIYSPLTESHTSIFVIRRRGVEKRGTPFQRGEGEMVD